MTGVRHAAAALLAGIALVAPASAFGAGDTYVVVQCSAANRGDEARSRQTRAYSLTRRCSERPDNSLQVGNLLPAKRGARGQYAWTAPPKTGIVRVRAQAKLRRHIGHRAHLLMADGEGNETYRVASGGTDPTPFRNWTWNGPRQRRFVARLTCRGGGGCDQSDVARTWIRDVRLTLTDTADPVVEASGSLLDGEWLRGTHSLRTNASDSGSGLASVTVRMNGVVIASRELDCERTLDGSIASALQPCPSGADSGLLSWDTRHGPFTEGSNSLQACAIDFAGDETCETHPVLVDNTAPDLAFAEGLADDPELVRVPVADPHSGVASGRIWLRAGGDEDWQSVPTQVLEDELRARVDSAAYPPGQYEFKAEATDVAGNHGETTLREDGWPMTATFPLRAGVTLDTWIGPGGQRNPRVAYGRARRAVGRLVARDGTPLAGKEVRVEERFGTGALIDRRVRTVTTDEEGRWRSRLPPGPSRRVFAHFDGDARYLDRESRVGRMAVTSRARFVTSRRRVSEGRRVVFRGKVARLGARYPNGGKLLELQVREGPRRWSTVREAFRTGPRGRYRLRYRFGRFYVRNVRFRFRVKIAREADWPYRQATSRPRAVTVVAR